MDLALWSTRRVATHHARRKSVRTFPTRPRRRKLPLPWAFEAGRAPVNSPAPSASASACLCATDAEADGAGEPTDIRNSGGKTCANVERSLRCRESTLRCSLQALRVISWDRLSYSSFRSAQESPRCLAEQLPLVRKCAWHRTQIIRFSIRFPPHPRSHHHKRKAQAPPSALHSPAQRPSCR